MINFTLRILFSLILIYAYCSAAFAQTQISNLITPVNYFVNHVKQLENIKLNLNKYGKTSLVGISGIGKTQLARMYGYEHKSNYDLIWVFDCNIDLNIQFTKLANIINLELNTNISKDPLSTIQETLDYLSDKNRFLLIFDNLKINQNHIIQRFINWESNGHIIFCSQDNFTLPNIINVNPFSKKDSTILTNKLLENNKDIEMVEFLVKKSNGFPILIVQSTQFLNKLKWIDKNDYKFMINESTDKIKSNITLAIENLTKTTRDLLHKIALINNKAVSKQLLDVISENNNASDDIYELSKLMLITNIDSDQNNPVFEMHDVVAQKVLEHYTDIENKTVMEEIISKIVKAIPASMHNGHVFRNSKTVKENLEIIVNNQNNYNLNPNKLIALNVAMFTEYVNNLQYYQAEKLFQWFDDLDSNGKFNIVSMNNDEKYYYARYLGMIGGYYKNRFTDWNTALNYYLRANKVLSEVEGYEAIKCNLLYNLANAYISLGYIFEAKKEIYKMEEMFINGTVKSEESGMLHLIKAKLYYNIGQYKKALEESDKDITETSKTGIKLTDLFFTVSYLLRLQILNELLKSDQAIELAEKLYNMHKPSKPDDHEIFSKIYTEIAKSYINKNHTAKSSAYIEKAIQIFSKQYTSQNDHKECELNDINLANCYFVKGNILFQQKDFKNAVIYYKKSNVIYFNIYKERMKNIAYISDLYTNGAKASCAINDEYNYKIFSEFQIMQFGKDHPNSINMLNYCKHYITTP